jgi:putative ABC transport system substrate-binding protein
MRRRDVLLLGAATAVAAHAAAQSQPRPKLYHIAIVLSTTPVSQINERDHPHLGAFLQELRRLGYTEGDNLIIERHSGEGRFEQFSDLARSVVETKPDLIVAITDAIARPFKAATSTIPLVIISSDPVAQGLVGSLARPGGNITGVSAYAGLETIGKYLEILREIDPRIQRIGLLAPRTTWERTYGAVLGEAADRLRIAVVGPPLESPVTEQEYHRVIKAMRSDAVQALLAEATGVNFAHVKTIAELAQVHHLPSLSAFAEHVRLGGLVSYATDFEDQYRRMAGQVHRILQGDSPGELPFYRPTTFKLLLNLKAAKALGLAIPPTLLARADEVIE